MIRAPAGSEASGASPAIAGFGLDVIRLGRVEYRRSLEWQRDLWERRVAGRVPDTLLLVEHPPTITFGSRPRPEHLLASPSELAEAGVALHRTGRGGDVTYHGPGQIVGYLIFDLTRRGSDLHRFVRSIESGLIETLAAFDIAAEREPGLPGVWAGGEKIAAIGIEVRRWVSRHGFALNLDVDLAGFERIVPCGIRDRGVTSMARILGYAPGRPEVEDLLVDRLTRAFPAGRSERVDDGEIS